MNRRQFLAATAVSGFTLGAHAAETRKLRVAVIGHTGRGNYGHGLDTMWQSVPETEIVAVVDADAKGLAAAKQRLKLQNGFTSYRQMLAETKPDIVSIAPRFIDEHRDMALAAIAAGARGIYMEKPFCRTPAEADEIVAACEKQNVKLALAHRNRFHPALPIVQQMLKDGAIGRLLEMRARGIEDTRGGALDLWVLGSHVLNLMHLFGGKPLACSAVLLKEGRPVTRGDIQEGAEGVGPIGGNQLHARFDMEIGVPAYFDSIQGTVNRAANFGVQLIGTLGIIDLRIDKEPLAHLVSGSPFQPTAEARPWTAISSAGAGKAEPVANLGAQVSNHLLAARDLIAAMRDNRAPLCSAHDGRVIVEMINAVFESHRLNGQRVNFPLASRQNPLAHLS